MPYVFLVRSLEIPTQQLTSRETNLICGKGMTECGGGGSVFSNLDCFSKTQKKNLQLKLCAIALELCSLSRWEWEPFFLIQGPTKWSLSHAPMWEISCHWNNLEISYPHSNHIPSLPVTCTDMAKIACPRLRDPASWRVHETWGKLFWPSRSSSHLSLSSPTKVSAWSIYRFNGAMEERIPSEVDDATVTAMSPALKFPMSGVK